MAICCYVPFPSQILNKMIEKLKELGFKWASKKKMWYFGEMKGRNPKEKSLDEIKAKYGSETLKSNEKRKIAS